MAKRIKWLWLALIGVLVGIIGIIGYLAFKAVSGCTTLFSGIQAGSNYLVKPVTLGNGCKTPDPEPKPEDPANDWWPFDNPVRDDFKDTTITIDGKEFYAHNCDSIGSGGNLAAEVWKRIPILGNNPRPGIVVDECKCATGYSRYARNGTELCVKEKTEPYVPKNTCEDLKCESTLPNSHCELTSTYKEAQCVCNTGYTFAGNGCVKNSSEGLNCDCNSGEHLVYNSRSLNQSTSVGCARNTDGLIMSYKDIACKDKCTYYLGSGVYIQPYTGGR